VRERLFEVARALDEEQVSVLLKQAETLLVLSVSAADVERPSGR
jgi:hypothetical protein